MDLVTDAIIFASTVHDGMTRKTSNVPYIMHPLEASVIVAEITSSQEVIAAAVLHDVIEDAGVSAEEIEKQFGSRVKSLVMAETENKRREQNASVTWKIRKEEAIQELKETQDIEVKILYLGDKLSNLRSIYRDMQNCGDNIWQKFNQPDPLEHKWYYTEIANSISDLKDFPAWKEYVKLIDIIFDKY